MESYQSFKDIPQFPHAGYQVNIAWKYVDKFFADAAKAYDINPDFQRGYVWTQYQKERYIEYRLRGGLSGRDIFLNCPNWHRDIGSTDWHDTLTLIDGKQRLGAVEEFLKNKVKAFGKFYSEYEGDLHHMRHDFVFRVNNLTTKKEVVEWYLGLNAGGSIHTENDLNTARNILKQLS